MSIVTGRRLNLFSKEVSKKIDKSINELTKKIDELIKNIDINTILRKTGDASLATVRVNGERKLGTLSLSAFTGAIGDSVYGDRGEGIIGQVKNGESEDVDLMYGRVQYLLFVDSVNTNTGIFYGSSAKLVTTHGDSNRKVNVLNLGATSNLGLTITAKNDGVLTLKASTNVIVNYHFVPI